MYNKNYDKEIQNKLINIIPKDIFNKYNMVNIFNIGSSRSRIKLDSFGPNIGTTLNELLLTEEMKNIKDKLNIVGTNDRNLMNLNIEEKVKEYKKDNRYDICIDAILSDKRELDNIIVSNSPIIPRSGIEKDKHKELGNMSISLGIGIKNKLLDEITFTEMIELNISVNKVAYNLLYILNNYYINKY